VIVYELIMINQPTNRSWRLFFTRPVTTVRACDGESNVISIKIKLIGLECQLIGLDVSIQSLYFILVMNDVIKDIQEDIPWFMLFADVLVLINQCRVRVNKKIQFWR
jgi:hypothetical protein